ncbi:MurR/RpiR family transcriptional regulator [Amycolatopsis jiangsuensis]|uniref:DNA-binding MurR/RpiR family transcriptional regulator n=1 Tax=Amycolatopsis jiangsuensis TaxID=1181879 RepID=A0A840IPQ2_9PSEU|nr:MurR/RpiR family transcriptional regulator [Amycolatopsis jiangsuensis]MBB4684491.1 DNA-binding MurR/RpiR family transcriptional regulator [Amycolatopsis jiangsuensis]
MPRPLHDLLTAHRLTPAQRRIASYLADHAADAAALTSAELAQYAEVSQPSVTRFVALLGFDGYGEFRRYLREAPTEPPAESGNKFQAAIDADLRTLKALRSQLADETRLRTIAAALMAGEPLIVAGYRVSAAQAASFAYLARKIHPDVRLVTDAGSVFGDALRHAHRRGAGVMVLFALPRYPRESAEALTQARALGLRTLLITDRPVSVLTPFADDVLGAGVASEFVFDSHAAVVSLSVALVEAMADAAGALARQRLEGFEDYAADQGLFLAE